MICKHCGRPAPYSRTGYCKRCRYQNPDTWEQLYGRLGSGERMTRRERETLL